MRPYLLDFLIEAHTAFQLLPTTLFLTVNLLDRYCSKRVVYKRHYQLVGCAALLIAAKYGDKKDRVPTIKELKSMCCSLYDDDMFIQMEWHVLQTLGWTIGHPTVDSFLQVAVMDSPYEPEVEHLALYILEIGLFHREFVSKLPSDFARASLALSRCILNRPQPRHTEWASQYDSMTLVGLSQQLHQPSQVLARKYSSAHYSRVSKLLEHFLARQASIASYIPPSPPSEVPAASKPYNGEIGLATPQKNTHVSDMANGYLTPPITPENEAFAHSGNFKGVAGGHMCASPTPPPSMQYMTPHAYQAEATYVPQFHPQPQIAFQTSYWDKGWVNRACGIWESLPDQLDRLGMISSAICRYIFTFLSLPCLRSMSSIRPEPTCLSLETYSFLSRSRLTVTISPFSLSILSLHTHFIVFSFARQFFFFLFSKHLLSLSSIASASRSSYKLHPSVLFFFLTALPFLSFLHDFIC